MLDVINPASATRRWHKMHVAGYQMHGIVRPVAGCNVVALHYQVVFLNIFIPIFQVQGRFPLVPKQG